MNPIKQDPIKCSEDRFVALLSKGEFTVPPHQRSYDWELQHIKDMLNDFKEALIKKPDSPYFLGLITLSQLKTKSWEIIDGQQRMITFSLICSYLGRTCYEKYHQQNINDANDFHNDAYEIVVKDFESFSKLRYANPRINPLTDYEDSYYDIVKDGESSDTKDKLTKAYGVIKNFFSDYSEDLKKYFDFLRENVWVAWLDVDKQQLDTTAVFEVINNRGKPLEQFDLLRNRIYSRFVSPEYSAKMSLIDNNLNKVKKYLKSEKSKGANPNNYASCYFQSKFGFYSTKKLYKEVKSKFDVLNVESIENVVDDFTDVHHINLYRIMRQYFEAGYSKRKYEAFESEMNQNIRPANKRPRSLKTLVEELAEYLVPHPLLFSLLYIFDKNRGDRGIAERVFRCIRLLNSFWVRTIIVKENFRPSHYGTKFNEKAKEILEAKDVNVDDFKKFLRDKCDNQRGGKLMDDDYFKKEFVQREIQLDNKKAKLFLCGLNQHLLKSSERDSKFELEHILPVSEEYGKHWKKFRNCKHSDYVNRVGNLTILREQDNVGIPEFNGQDLDGKREVYRNSEAKITVMVVEKAQSVWSPSTIKNREEYLARLATEVWQFDEV